MLETETPSDNVWGLEIISADGDNEGMHDMRHNDIYHYQDLYDFQLPRSEESDMERQVQRSVLLEGYLLCEVCKADMLIVD